MGLRIDVNADVGEGIGRDPELIPLVSSANVACGVHAGDAATMTAAVRLARAHGVAVGAHPSYPDRDGFGRREMPLSPEEVEACVAAQVVALRDIAAAEGVALRHVKPHGALYNVAARDSATAGAIVRAIAGLDPRLVLFGLAGSVLIEVGKRAGLQTAAEAFADRGYLADATLAPRDMPGAVLHDAAVVVPRAVAMIRDKSVVAVDGSRIRLDAETLCVHGDTPDAVRLASGLRQALAEAGIGVKAFGG
jgi:UPF0271 protein